MIFYTPSKLNYNISTINRWITKLNVTFSIFIPHERWQKLQCRKWRCIQSGWSVLWTLISMNCFKIKKAVKSRSCAVMIDHHRHSRTSPAPSFWHFSSDRVQTQTRLWLRLIRSTLEIMRDYTLVCESTNTTIVFSQAALLTGGFTEAKGSSVSLSGEPKCWGRAILSTVEETARIPT